MRKETVNIVTVLLNQGKEKDMKTTLLIMAAGIGSRFGTGIKQLEPVDASNQKQLLVSGTGKKE